MALTKENLYIYDNRVEYVESDNTQTMIDEYFN